MSLDTAIAALSAACDTYAADPTPAHFAALLAADDMARHAADMAVAS